MPNNMPIPKDPAQCPPWLYEYLKRLNQTSNKASVGIAQIVRGEVPDGSGTPLTPDLSQYFFLPGRSGGQTGYGGKASSENLVLSSTASTTKGKIHLGSTVAKLTVDEAQSLVGINKSSPSATLHIVGSTSGVSGAMTTTFDQNGLHTVGDGTGTPGAGGWRTRTTSAGTAVAANSCDYMADDDGLTHYSCINFNTDGANPQICTLSGVITPGATYTITLKVLCLFNNPNTSLQNWMGVSLVDSAGNVWSSIGGASEAFSNANSPHGITAHSTVFTITRTVTCSGTPVTTGQTPNSIRLHAEASITTNGDIYVGVTYLTVAQAGSPLARWDLSTGTQSGQIDLSGRMGINTGSADLAAELTVIPDGVATIGLKITAAASQTADLLRVTNSGGTALGGITSAGNPYLVAGAAVDAVLASDASGVGSWASLVAWEDEIIFWEDSPVYA